MLEQIEAARREGLILVVQGRDMGMPIAVTHLAVQLMLKKRDVWVPPDVFAFLSESEFSDSQVLDWDSPTGR